MAARFLAAVAIALAPAGLQADSIDGRVIQFRMPLQNVNVLYVEAKGGMTIELRAASASVTGTKFYVGDGEVAIEMKVEPGRGMVLQGDKIEQGSDVFKKDATVNVKSGYKKASDLKPGDVYVTIPAVAFELPKK